MNQLLVGQMVGALKIVRVIGKGSTACVYEAKHSIDMELQPLCMKVIPKLEKFDEAYENELNFLRRLYFVDGAPHQIMHSDMGDVRFIATSLHGLSLDAVLENHPKKSLSAESLLSLLYAIVEVTSRLHEKDIIHRDIKPGNVLMKLDPQNKATPIVITDFGHSISLMKRDDDDQDEIFESCFYSTPSMMKKRQATRKSDLLMCFYCILDLTGSDPFEENKTEDITEVCKKKEEFEVTPETVVNQTWIVDSVKPLLMTKDLECPKYEEILKAIRGAKKGFDPKDHRLMMIKGEKGDYLE